MCENEDKLAGFILLMFVIFFCLVFTSCAHQQPDKEAVSSCVWYNIEAHEQNRESFPPYVSEVLLHDFVMECFYE